MWHLDLFVVFFGKISGLSSKKTLDFFNLFTILLLSQLQEVVNKNLPSFFWGVIFPGRLTWNILINLFWKGKWSEPNLHLGVSKNSGTPKSSILIGFSIINHPFWGTPIYGNLHLERSMLIFQGEFSIRTRTVLLRRIGTSDWDRWLAPRGLLSGPHGTWKVPNGWFRFKDVKFLPGP